MLGPQTSSHQLKDTFKSLDNLSLPEVKQMGFVQETDEEERLVIPGGERCIYQVDNGIRRGLS